MFTGLIEEIGVVSEQVISEIGMKLTILCNKIRDGLNIGDSVAVNGVCLTVIAIGNDSFTADIMHETVNKTDISSYKTDTPVNLERSLAVGQRMGGHFVQGHVDGTGIIDKETQVGNAILFRFCVDPELTHWMVGRGSVAVNGISLTLVDVGRNFFEVSIIPHTLRETNLGQIHVGDVVNIECDIVGKYIAKWALAKEDSHVLSSY